MKKGENYNHPVKGSQIKVDPITDIKDIQTIKKLLKDRPRDLALFTLGINTNLRASDLLGITAGMVRNTNEIEIKEKKTGKYRRITLNQTCQDAIKNLLASNTYFDFTPLIRGKYKGAALTVPAVNLLVKKWCKMINLKGNYGSHTLRKTWGYHQRVTFGVDLARLTYCFNHSSVRQTLDYLCLQPDEIRDVYEHEL